MKNSESNERVSVCLFFLRNFSTVCVCTILILTSSLLFSLAITFMSEYT